MSQDFGKGKIYKITNDFNDDVYVGSTCDTLIKRFSSHKQSRKDKTKYHKPLYKLMNEIGFERFRIDLIEDCPCDDKYQLRQREGYFIRQFGTLNIEIAGRTIKEWENENKEHKREYRKQNQEHIQEIKHINYENKKHLLLEKVVCECGCSVNVSNLLRHQRTKKHLYLLKQ